MSGDVSCPIVLLYTSKHGTTVHTVFCSLTLVAFLIRIHAEGNLFFFFFFGSSIDPLMNECQCFVAVAALKG